MADNAHMAANLTNVNGLPLPPGTYYFARITDTDHAGYVWIVALLTLLYPLGSLFVRLNVRWGLYGADDWTLVAATFLAMCQHVPLFIGLRSGFGKSSSVLEQSSLPGIDEALYAAEILFVLSYVLSKVSLALFVRRLFTHNVKVNAILSWSLLIGTLGWGVVALFVILVRCSPYHYFSTTDSCPSNISRWRAITALDVVTEIALMAIPSYLVSGVMIGSRPKMLVMTAFAFRLGVVTFSVVHLQRLTNTADAEDAGFAYISPAIWIQIWLAWSLVSASIPSFRAFMQPFDNITVARTDDTHSASRSELNGAYLMMGPISKSKNSNHGASGKSGTQGISVSSKLGTRTSVHHESSRDRNTDENRSLESWHSQTGIIRKEVEWEIRHDGPL